jgi:hypothetical protein
MPESIIKQIEIVIKQAEQTLETLVTNPDLHIAPNVMAAMLKIRDLSASKAVEKCNEALHRLETALQKASKLGISHTNKGIVEGLLTPGSTFMKLKEDIARDLARVMDVTPSLSVKSSPTISPQGSFITKDDKKRDSSKITSSGASVGMAISREKTQDELDHELALKLYAEDRRGRKGRDIYTTEPGVPDGKQKGQFVNPDPKKRNKHL